MTHMNAGAPDKSNDGWTPGGGDESDRLGPGIWKIIAVAVAGAFMPLLSTAMANLSLSSTRSQCAAQSKGCSLANAGDAAPCHSAS
jgi:hypothetical protein